MYGLLVFWLYSPTGDSHLWPIHFWIDQYDDPIMKFGFSLSIHDFRPTNANAGFNTATKCPSITGLRSRR